MSFSSTDPSPTKWNRLKNDLFVFLLLTTLPAIMTTAWFSLQNHSNDFVATLVTFFILALFFSVPAAAITLLRWSYRAFGMATFLPFVIFPIFFFLAITTFDSFIIANGKEILDVIRTNVSNHEWEYIQELSKIGPAARVPALAMIAIILLLPFLVKDVFVLILDWGIFFSTLKMFSALLLMMFFSLFPAVILSSYFLYRGYRKQKSTTQ